MDSIFADINSVGASYLELVDTTDTDYAARKEKREITITFDGATVGNSGEAQFEYGDNNRFSKCTITADTSLLDNSEFFIKRITHEIGHCLGLDHPQETIHSVMSYYSSSDTVRFQIDDKMGLIYLYLY
jgi:predicted Zn-dependent protease